MRSELRAYQREALDWALSTARRSGGAVVSLPTGTGKTMVAVAFVEHFLKRGYRALVLEPTRFLVEQTARLFAREGIGASMVHSGVKERDWGARVVVSTPESALSHLSSDPRQADAFGVVVVDECHHTVGRDPFAQVMEMLSGSLKLGLSALVPRGKMGEITRYIGPVKRWEFADLEGKGYEKPYMIAEVYEAEFRPVEESIYRRLYDEWLYSPVKTGYTALTLSILSRDGSDAILDSASKQTEYAQFLARKLPLSKLPQHPHKLEALRRVLEDYEGNYEKAIVFVNRRCTALLLASALRDMNPVTIIGGARMADPLARRSLLERARSPETRVIIATSAGDEGLDVPEADLLVFWSHVSSPLRFYQRLGRGLRPHGDRVKYAVFIVTPGTRDYDALPGSLSALAYEGVDIAGIFDEVDSAIAGEGAIIAGRLAEASRRLGYPAVKLETFLGTFKRGGLGGRGVRRLLGELEGGAWAGLIVYYYDVGEVYSEIVSRLEAGYPEITLVLGRGERRYAPISSEEETVRNAAESFVDSRLCIDPVSDMSVRGLEPEAERRLMAELYERVVSGLTASEASELLAGYSSRSLSASIRWRFRVENVVVRYDGWEASLAVTAWFGPFMLRSRRQLRLELMNTAALWHMVRGLASYSRGIGLCDRLVTF